MENPVKIGHLNVGLQHDFFLAGEIAVGGVGQGADPGIPGFQGHQLRLPRMDVFQGRGIGGDPAVAALLFPLQLLPPGQGGGLVFLLRRSVNGGGRFQLEPQLPGGGAEADHRFTAGAVLLLRPLQRLGKGVPGMAFLPEGLLGLLPGLKAQGSGQSLHLLLQGGQGGFTGCNAVFQGTILCSPLLGQLL